MVLTFSLILSSFAAFLQNSCCLDHILALLLALIEFRSAVFIDHWHMLPLSISFPHFFVSSFSCFCDVLWFSNGLSDFLIHVDIFTHLNAVFKSSSSCGWFFMFPVFLVIAVELLHQEYMHFDGLKLEGPHNHHCFVGCCFWCCFLMMTILTILLSACCCWCCFRCYFSSF